MCSAIVTSAIGAIVSAAANVGVYDTNGITKSGTLKNAAASTGLKSTSPSIHDNIYPEAIPIKKGTTLKNPLAFSITSPVTKNVNNATITPLMLIASVPSAIPILDTADDASPSPIIIIIGPITIGGSIF